MSLPEGFSLTDMDRLGPDPLVIMHQWLDDAAQYSGRPNPNAAALATCGRDGQPAARMLLLKGLDARGAVVYTNLQSDKGTQIAENPHAALLFHWDLLGRQLRISGAVSQVEDAEADAYWVSRPWGSQVGGVASDQSRPLADRGALADRVAEVAELYPVGSEVPRPAHWTGLRVALERIEFWQEGDDRLHDRIVYEAKPGGWEISRRWP
ncbi:MAG: pyridoxamine 5'-phosphate oxidase [Phycisphaerales bacterium]|nr:pyridoxamine 5'-phosphate oxidase [Phycisphaerales bacterium]